MFSSICFILSSFLIFNYRRKIYRYILLLLISCYLYVIGMCKIFFPKYICVKTSIHRTMDLDYSVYDYWIKYNNKFYKLKVIEDNNYGINNALMIYKPYNMNLINNCGILDKNREYVRDITQEIRYFMYYRGLIEWKYILVHLNIENEEFIVMYMNDIDMTNKYLSIKEIYNEKFNF